MKALFSIAIFMTELWLSCTWDPLVKGLLTQKPKDIINHSLVHSTFPLLLGLIQTPVAQIWLHRSPLPYSIMYRSPHSLLCSSPLSPNPPWRMNAGNFFQSHRTGRVKGLWDCSKDPKCINCHLVDSGTHKRPTSEISC